MEALIISLTIIGQSSSPTPYKVKMPKEQYVRCGADILLNAVRNDLKGEARCIVCGRTTKITIVEGKISKLEPASAVLHVVEIRSTGQNAQIVCEASPIFDKKECLQFWLNNYDGPPGQVHGLRDYMARAAELVSERVGPARLEPAKLSAPASPPIIRCADCDCSPAECSASKSAMDCPSCLREPCCCWVAPTSAA